MRAQERAAYLSLSAGKLNSRANSLREIMHSCVLCPRKCGCDRIEGELGVCGIGPEPVVSSYGPHFGEERPLVGSSGSGTIFFTGCNLRCSFCQNYEISHLGRGDRLDPMLLAGARRRTAALRLLRAAESLPDRKRQAANGRRS